MTHKPCDVTLLYDLDAIERMGLGRALVALRAEGYPTLACTRNEVAALAIGDQVGCWLGFGSISFIREAIACLHHVPLAYFSNDRFNFSRYAHKLPTGCLLNDDAIFLPCLTLLSRVGQMKKCFAGERLFVRPDSGSKVFTGNSFSYTELASELSSLKQLTSLTDDTLLAISSAKSIQAEYRFFIVNKAIVGGSAYSFDGLHNADIPDGAILLAQTIANHEWQIDVAYTCDVALTENGFRVVELNAGSTSGFYEADARNIIRAMAEAAWLEFIGELSMEN
ncbi:ATP-grasp domain-containing protein (plasmid) [Pseudomonas sp. FeN3W]|nr:ATP-grasp domain-containing protein [Pseudomonas sp. FeN3W]